MKSSSRKPASKLLHILRPWLPFPSIGAKKKFGEGRARLKRGTEAAHKAYFERGEIYSPEMALLQRAQAKHGSELKRVAAGEAIDSAGIFSKEKRESIFGIMKKHDLFLSPDWEIGAPTWSGPKNTLYHDLVPVVGKVRARIISIQYLRLSKSYSNWDFRQDA